MHGSHKAPPPEVGLIRGAFGLVGNAALPKPVGGIWAINGNIGEWHVLTEDGFYLTRLFQGDRFKTQWPDQAVPGAILDNVPPGLGGEDFGGSMRQGKDGKVYVQAGKTGLWNVEVTGLETIQEIPGGKVAMGAEDVKTAQTFREKQMQAAVGNKKYAVRKATVAFTGNLDADFKGFQDPEKPAFKRQSGRGCGSPWPGTRPTSTSAGRCRTTRRGSTARTRPSSCTPAATPWTSSSGPTPRPTRNAANP